MQFKTGSVYEDHYFDEELSIIERAQQIIDDFYEARIIDQTIMLNTPEIWYCEEDTSKGLVEPMTENFEKFNSNTGWAPKSGNVWSQAIQALSHFSYHDSGGELLLCDLQGGSYSNRYVLGDPVIMSKAQNCGPADLGQDGINSFFNRHRCRKYCRPGWIKPKKVDKAIYPEREGTTMIAPEHLPHREDRTPLTFARLDLSKLPLARKKKRRDSEEEYRPNKCQCG